MTRSSAMGAGLRLCAAALLAATAGMPVRAATWAEQGLPVYEHIVIVIEENKNFDRVIGSRSAPFINRLATEGALFTRMYGEEHNSEGNYFWLFAGDRFDLGFRDQVPARSLDASNLGRQLIQHGFSFKGYSEDLPQIGSTAETWPSLPCGTACRYARKHVPWASFPDLCPQPSPQGCAHLRFSDFPSDLSKLPTVSIVVPNLLDDMHGVARANSARDIDTQVQLGDTWLRRKLGAYYQWARTHNSLLIVTFDENENSGGFAGLTDPASSDPALQNRIATVFAGARIRPGAYAEGRGITHVNILRTIEAMYGLDRSGAQQPRAQAAGIGEEPVTDVFTAR